MSRAPVASLVVGLDLEPPQGVVVAIDREPAQAGPDGAGLVVGCQAELGQGPGRADGRQAGPVARLDDPFGGAVLG